MDSVTVSFQSQNVPVMKAVIKILLASYLLLYCSCTKYTITLLLHILLHLTL